MIYIEYPLLKPAARNDSAARTMQVLNFHVKERNLLMLKLLFFFFLKKKKLCRMTRKLTLMNFNCTGVITVVSI